MRKENELMNKPDTVEFNITRIFDAPRDLVWKAHTEEEHLRHWWGPKGCAIQINKFDFRQGGSFHYKMTMPDGFIMWGKFVYCEIVTPQQLVFINSFADEEGNTIKAPFSEDWPLEMLVHMDFSEENGKTTLKISSTPLNATPGENKVFEDGFNSMQQGFGGTYDQLTQYLKTI